LKKHVKLYLSFFGYDNSSFIACEVCGKQAHDIHHIEARGMGGSKLADHIDNLQALCRECHMKFGDIKQYKEFLKEVHNDYKYRRGN
jgi:5-methylcytosine-specific restriction endonuclease McrA